MTAIALALLFAVSPMSQPSPGSSQTGSSCTRWTSYRTPPRTIRVLRAKLHRVDKVPFRLYVERVMASGAFPAWLPMESLKVGAIVVSQYAWYHSFRPHRSGARSGHRCMDIRDGGWGQYYRHDVRVHSKIKRAVDAVWGVSVRKNGRFIRTGWSGDGGRCGRSIDGWHIPENATSDCARKGWGWRRIVRVYLRPVTIVEPSR